MPWRICSKAFGGRRVTCSVSSARSIVMICDALATESFGSLLTLAGSSVFPGAPAPFDVASQRDTHDGRKLAAIQGMPLHDDDGPSKTETGAGCLRKVGPPHVALCLGRTRRTAWTFRAASLAISTPPCRSRRLAIRLGVAWYFRAKHRSIQEKTYRRFGSAR